MTSTEGSWEVETLIRKAFARTKDRFLTYVLGYFVMVGLMMLVIFALAIMIIFGGTVFAVKANMIAGALVLALIILAGIAILYMTSFSQLLLTYTIIRSDKGTLMQNIREIKPLIWGFVWFMLASSIFMIGLIPFGFLSIFVIFILWMFWGTFASFIYLDRKLHGLDNLWTSYSMVNQRFWGVAGRMLILMVGYFILMGIFSIPYDPQSSAASAILSLLQFIIGIVFGAFTLSYDYEIFKLLKVPEKVERPTMWIIFSIIGWVLMVLLLFASGQSFVNAGNRMRDFLKDNYKRDYQYRQTPSDLDHDMVRYPRSS